MTDDKTRQLENRIDKLESTIEKMMPSRREALKMGGAALAGGSLMAGTASAGTNQVGTIGSASQPVDIESEDINNADTVTTENLVVNNTATGVAQDLQGCRVFLSSDQSTSGRDDKIQFDSVVYNNGNNFDTNSHNFTCPKTGVYFANVGTNFIGGGDNQRRQLRIGNASSSVVSGKGAFEVSSELDRFDHTQVCTLNRYVQGQTIAGYGGNQASSDILKGGGSAGGETYMEVVFLGSL